LQNKVREAKQQAESLSSKPSEWNIQRKQMKKSISDAPLMGLDL